ncbi:hypothetical protein P3T76_010689 [Phytophthora citrophthora]|uniref:Uncharacterized protein n=1 Tax=Phytophthora citrophthora TaxID=4793 RepID=A0AAD9GBU2_9STRA|nr:hypothetical protein P3T76_010689 [Phytophthora citrophthora]
MNFCSLRPPNFHVLSDDIVGGVLQRSRAAKYSSENGGVKRSQQPYGRPPAYERPRVRSETKELIPQRDADAVLGLLSLTSGQKRKREQTPDFAPCKSRDVRAESSGETDTESQQSDRQEHVAPVWAVQNFTVVSRTCKTKEDEQMILLEKETRQLREEVNKFEQRRHAISKAVSRHQNGWDVALEYFQLFRFGLQAPRRGRPSKNQSANAQLDFLQSTMTPNVVFNSGQGPQAMLRSWKCMSLWFQDVEQKLETMDRGAAGSLAVMTRTGITITERTLRNVFPHLITQNGSRSELAEKLLGQRIVMRGLTRFEWNSEVSRFTSVVAYSDLLTPLLELLGNVGDVARVFERSAISPDFQWRTKAPSSLR